MKKSANIDIFIQLIFYHLFFSLSPFSWSWHLWCSFKRRITIIAVCSASLFLSWLITFKCIWWWRRNSALWYPPAEFGQSSGNLQAILGQSSGILRQILSNLLAILAREIAGFKGKWVVMTKKFYHIQKGSMVYLGLEWSKFKGKVKLCFLKFVWYQMARWHDITINSSSLNWLGSGGAVASFKRRHKGWCIKGTCSIVSDHRRYHHHHNQLTFITGRSLVFNLMNFYDDIFYRVPLYLWRHDVCNKFSSTRSLLDIVASLKWI